MAIDYDKLMNWPFGQVEQTYTAKDSILYALGLGLGADPLDTDQLRYVFEEAAGFAALPTMAVVLAALAVEQASSPPSPFWATWVTRIRWVARMGPDLAP